MKLLLVLCFLLVSCTTFEGEVIQCKKMCIEIGGTIQSYKSNIFAGHCFCKKSINANWNSM